MTLLKLSYTQGIHSFRYVQGTEVLSLTIIHKLKDFLKTKYKMTSYVLGHIHLLRLQ